jgi:uncharacterized protein
MKCIRLFALTLLLLSSAHSFSQEKNNSSIKMLDNISSYWFVMLTPGNNRSQDSATEAKLMNGHLDNIKRLHNLGKLKVAGPFTDKGKWTGLFIFECANKDEVEQLLKTDPEISSGRLTYEIHPWLTAAVGSFEKGKPKVVFE